jgi:hypothetical protein
LANVSNGITVTVFPAPATLGFQYLGIDYSNPLASPACRLSVNSGTPPQTGNVYTNGIRGSYTNITQNNLASMVQLMNIYYKPGCNIKVQDLVVTIIGLYDWQDGVFSPLRFTPLDAAAIGIGQNVVPLP